MVKSGKEKKMVKSGKKNKFGEIWENILNWAKLG